MKPPWERPLAGLLLTLATLATTLATAPSALALPATQSISDVEGDTTITLWVKDQAIDGDIRTWCRVRVQVVDTELLLTAGDEISVRVYEDDLLLDDLIFETTLTVTASEAAAGLVDHTLDCAGSFFTGDVGLAVEIYAEATAAKATCGTFCFYDTPKTANVIVTIVDDDIFEEDDGFGDAVPLAAGSFADRVCRDADWWTFQLSEPSQLTLGLLFDPTVGALSAAVLDATNQAEVVGSTATTGGAELEAVLPAGTYYLRVTHDAGADYNFYDYTVFISTTGCSPGDTEDRDCGNCGLETRSCGNDGTWGEFGACAGEGDCTPGDTEGRACDGGAEQRTCETSCVWSAYGPCEGGCASGETEACYGGPTDTEGVGVCVGGNRTCTDGVWGECEGEVQPSYEQCSDDLDNDCDGTTDRADTNCSTALPPPAGCGCSTRGLNAPLGGALALLFLLLLALQRRR